MEDLLNTQSKDKWAWIGTRKRAGMLTPLFYVYSRDSVGIGDFEDLKSIVDWCKETGNSILQLLPMNEVGPLFCPYDSVSSFALEPAYISLNNLPASKKSSVKNRISEIRKKYPAGQGHVDYRVKDEKLKLTSPVAPGSRV